MNPVQRGEVGHDTEMPTLIDRLPVNAVRAPSNLFALAVFAVLALSPLYASDFFVDFVLTRTMMLGIAAATVVFLIRYGGMTSLAQLLLWGVSGFMVGNASVSEAGSKGLKLGWNVWVSVVFALVVATAVAFLLGAISSRTTGIYYLMLTFVFAVIGFFFFGQVTTFSGFGGITGIDPPDVLADQPTRLFLLTLVLSAAAYLGLRKFGSTPFGLVLQGIRDDPIRMAALGYNVPLHRTLAFTAAGFVAAVAGVLNVWWNGQIDPTSISVGPTIDLLVVAIIGGIARLEGAWIGAFIFVAANNYLRDLPFAAELGIGEDRFNTVVGLLVLLIVTVSPDGVVGLLDKLRRRERPGPGQLNSEQPDPGQPDPEQLNPEQPDPEQPDTEPSGEARPTNRNRGRT